MKQAGSYRIAADRQAVWEALNDPGVLADCIAGCQSMEQTADNAFAAKVKAKVGPVSAAFDVVLNLVDVNAPVSYAIEGSLKGGAAGFGKGRADVSLTEENGDGDEGVVTVLGYEVEANVGGKLAQVGARLIDAAARKMADDFFSAFSNKLGGAQDDAAPATTDADKPQSDTRGRYEPSGMWPVWAVVFIGLLIAIALAI